MPRGARRVAACPERRAARRARAGEPQVPAEVAHRRVQPLPGGGAARLRHLRVRDARGRERHRGARARSRGPRAQCALQVQPHSVQPVRRGGLPALEPGAHPALRRHPAARRHHGDDAQDPRRRHRCRLRPARGRCLRPHPAEPPPASQGGACMKTIPKTIMLLLVAACAADPAREGPGADSRTQIGEVGEPRNRARIHTELAAAYFERGNMAVALEELRVAAGADSTYAPAYSLFGLVYMELRERDLAAKNFERALSLAPNHGEINHNYGLFLCQTERAPDSIKYFMQAVKNPLYATPSRSYSAAGLCTLRTKNAKEAEQFFERALRLEPDEPASLINLSQIRY